MPLFGAAQAGGQLTSLIPGEVLSLFAADSVTAPQASMAVSRGYSPGGFTNFGITFQITFASSPTAVTQILGTNVYQYPGKAFVLTEWTVLYTSTNLQSDSYTDAGASRFYCGYVVSQSGGGAITLTANA
jgi:hypothetical protein